MYPPKFQTDFFTLKHYSPKEEDRFVEIALDKISLQYMGGATGIEEEERKLFRKIFQIYNRSEERWFWIWGIYQKDLLCGHLELKETEHTSDQELEIVYMIHPNERRKGIMSKVLSFLKEKQHDWQKKIIATLSPENSASIALLQKWGIEKAEILKDKETKETFLKLTLKE